MKLCSARFQVCLFLIASLTIVYLNDFFEIVEKGEKLISEMNDNWKLNYFHDVELSFAWQGKTVTSKMKWNNSTDKFENDELLETLLKIWNNSSSQ